MLAAVERDLEVVAISDHGPNHLLHYGMASLGVLATIRTELEEACGSFPQITGLVGVEANIISVRGDLDLPPEHAHLVDVVLANIHSMVRPASFRDATLIWGSHFGKKVFPSLDKRSKLINTEATVNALLRNKIDILTHPGLRFAIDYRVVAQACAIQGTAFELNSSKPYLTPELVELVAKEGAPFVIGSDAHSPQRVGDFALGLELAKKVGLTPKEVLNARSLT